MSKGLMLTVAVAMSLGTSANEAFFDHPQELVLKIDKNSINDLQVDFPLAKFDILNKSSKDSFRYVKLKFEGPEKASLYKEELLNRTGVLSTFNNRILLEDPREFIPSDSQIAKQYHHKIIKSYDAWDELTGDEPIVVAVTDDGFRLDHEDLKKSWHVNNNEIPNNGIDDDGNGYIDDFLGWNFNNKNNDSSSDDRWGGHGTHVAGIIAADHDNGLGVSGVAPKAKVMPLKFYGSERWSSAVIFETYAYAADNGAHIISTSYNIDYLTPNPLYREAINYAYDRGLIILNSAGNAKKEEPPRMVIDEMVFVGSTISDGSSMNWKKRSKFSNYGYGVDISAPGNPIFSTSWRGTYVNLSGTSMSTPLVAGVVANIWSQNINLTREQVLHKLYSSSTNIDSENKRYKSKLGAGLVNSYEAIKDNSDLSVRSINYDRRTGVLRVFFKGLVSKDSNTRVLINEDGMTKELEYNDSIKAGTTYLKYQLKKSSTYDVTIEKENFIDPFGVSLDQNYFCKITRFTHRCNY